MPRLWVTDFIRRATTKPKGPGVLQDPYGFVSKRVSEKILDKDLSAKLERTLKQNRNLKLALGGVGLWYLLHRTSKAQPDYYPQVQNVRNADFIYPNY